MGGRIFSSLITPLTFGVAYMSLQECSISTTRATTATGGRLLSPPSARTSSSSSFRQARRAPSLYSKRFQCPFCNVHRQGCISQPRTSLLARGKHPADEIEQGTPAALVSRQFR